MIKATTQDVLGGVISSRNLLPIIILSASYVLDSASVSDVIGVFSGSANYTLDADASGQFAISGDELQVAGALTAGYYTITVGSDDGAIDFSIKVLAA